MKKLFLTSGVLMCMACPAIADPTGFTASQGSSSGTTTVGNACNVGTIGVTTGTTNLLADWTDNTFQITLNNNDTTNGYASGNMYSCSLTGTNSCSANSDAQNKTIYGIINGATGDSQVYKDKDTNGNLVGGVSVGSVILTEHPTGKTVTHTINPNFEYITAQGGDTYTTSSTTYSAGTGYTSPARAFDGAFSAQTGGTKYIDDAYKLTQEGLDAAKAGTPATWYAQYKCATPSVTTKPSLTGYTLDSKFYTTRNATTYVPSTAMTACINNSDTVYAKWTPKTYTITYAAGKPNTAPTGVNVSMPSDATSGAKLSVQYDRAYTTASAPTLTGHQFAGWQANYKLDEVNNSTATTYQANTQIFAGTGTGSTVSRWKSDNNVTFTALWTRLGYEITLDLNTPASGITGNPVAGSLTKLYTLYNDDVYKETGHTTKLATTGTQNFGTLPQGPQVTLSYNLHLPTSASGSAYTSPTVASDTKRRAFNGFFEAKTGGSALISSGGLLTGKSTAIAYDENKIWYAQWGNAATETAAYPSLNGYTFAGWYTNANYTGATVGESTSYPITTNTELHAKWTPKTTTVKYDCGKSAANVAGTWNANATGFTNQSKTATFDAAYSHPTGSSVCSLPGYTFSNWYCVNGTTGSTTSGQLTNNGIVNNKWHVDSYNANATCTAVWTKETITLKWNTANGTPSSINDTSCVYDESVTLPTNPTRTGYTFNGWLVSNN